MTRNDTRHDETGPTRAAIAALLDEYGGMIYGLGLRLTGHPDQAEDLMQETFLQAFRKWDQFRSESKPSTWLYTIAVRKFLRMQRRRSGEPRRMPSLDELLPFGEKPVPHLPSRGETPLDISLRNEALQELETAIVDLPPDYRIPLVLKEIFGCSVAQVAGILRLKEATVKTRLHRARGMIFHTVTSVLPLRAAPPAAYSKRVCMDLLQAKQESLDNGVPFPVSAGEFCQRCKSVFEAMDFTQGLCNELATDTAPAGALSAVLRELDEDEG